MRSGRSRRLGRCSRGAVDRIRPGHCRGERAFASPRVRFTANLVGNNTWWFDPILLGSYPAEGLASVGAIAQKILAGDMDTFASRSIFLA